MLTQQINDAITYYAGQYQVIVAEQRGEVRVRINGLPNSTVISRTHSYAVAKVLAMPADVREQALADFAKWALFSAAASPRTVIA
jgi:hypothetical protein